MKIAALDAFRFESEVCLPAAPGRTDRPAHGNDFVLANQVVNGDFVSDVSGWQGAGTVTWGALDAGNDSGSGSLKFVGNAYAHDSVFSGHIADGTVTADDIAQNTIYGGNIEDNSTHSADIHDGTITGADTDGRSVWATTSRQNLYMRSDSHTIPINNGVGEPTAVCDDAANLPVSGECHVVATAGAFLRDFGPINWANPAQPAAWQCQFQRNSTIDITVYARIHCLDLSP